MQGCVWCSAWKSLWSDQEISRMGVKAALLPVLLLQGRQMMQRVSKWH